MSSLNRTTPPVGAKALWSWHDDAQRTWKTYDAATTQQLETAFQQGASSTVLNQGYFATHPTAYLVDFATMVQVNTQTKYARRIERSYPLQMVANYDWQWRDDDGTWKSYDPTTAQLLEFHPRPQLYLTCGLLAAHPNLYSVDLSLMKQFNQKTGRARAMQRLEGGAPPPAAVATNPQPSAPPMAAAQPPATGGATGGLPLMVATGQPHLGLSQHGIPHNVVASLQEATGVQAEDTCCICMGPLFEADPADQEAVVQLPCTHYFHGDCMVPAVNNRSLKCSVCQAIHGEPHTGNQPPGTIQLSRNDTECAGYPGCGSLLVTYSFPSGVQGPNHPSPGQGYRGDGRTGILPDNDKGRLVRSLLQVAFERRLVFSIGHSLTLGPGAGERIVWAGIHHKTSYQGAHGYPDPGYLDRVLAELAAVGVTPDALN